MGNETRGNEVRRIGLAKYVEIRFHARIARATESSQRSGSARSSLLPCCASTLKKEGFWILLACGIDRIERALVNSVNLDWKIGNVRVRAVEVKKIG